MPLVNTGVLGGGILVTAAISIAGYAPDPGTMEYWQAGYMPPSGPNNINSGTMEYWQVGYMPPVLTAE